MLVYFFIVNPRFFEVVDEVTPGSVRAEPDSMKRATEFRFVFGMTSKIAQFIVPVGELTFVSVLTGTGLLEWAAKLGLVPRGWLAYTSV